MITVSIIVAMIQGNADSVMVILSAATKVATENIFVIGGMLCLWSGLFNILKNTDIVKKIATKLKKIIYIIFKRQDLTDTQVENISLNITSNALGIGNAATIYGLKAIDEMQKNNLDKKSSTDNMNILTVINAASLQLIPTTMITLRAANGSKDPSNILIPVWIVSGVSLLAGLAAIKILNKRS